MEPSLGKFEHYKGTIYEVIAVGTHTETLESLVIYRAVDRPEKIWIRPHAMFYDWVDWKLSRVPRFKKISDD